jgi:hypothetical protein
MARRYGRAPRGERLRAGVPHGHWKTTTFVAGLSRTGMIAPWVLDGPMNCDAFTTYVTRVLVPELSPGNVVIMDNLSNHKAPAVRVAIEAAGARLLFLPPFRHSLGVDPPAQRRERSLRSLYCCSDGVRGRGAPVTYLSHMASFHSNERIAPSNRGIKHWRRVATRYDRCPTVCLSAIALAATVISWL